MTTLISLGIGIVVCLLIAYIIHRINPYSEAITTFAVLGFVCVISLFITWLSYSNRDREYDEFIRERNVFTTTLNNSRTHGREIEAAAIIKDVIEWNQKLAEIQYRMTRQLIGEFYDERFETLKPIE